MKIGTIPTLASLEDSVSESATSKDERLQLPIKPRANAPGVEASLLQTVVTWARNNPGGALELHLSDDDAKRAAQVEKFVRKQPSGLVATGMVPTMVSAGGASLVEIEPSIERHLEAFHESPDQNGQLDLFDSENDGWSESKIPAMGPKLFLPCLDHYEEGRIPHLYIDSQTLRTRVEFNALVTKLLQRLSNSSASTSGQQNPFSPELTKGISRIVYELFDNTHKWAMNDSSGRELETSSRGILLRLI